MAIIEALVGIKDRLETILIGIILKDAKKRTLLFLFKMSYLINFKECLKIEIFTIFFFLKSSQKI